MGKYMRKSKATGDVVTVMEVPQPPTTTTTLGVRTRAKTLALQRLNSSSPSSSSPTCNPDISSSTPPSSLCYLQLRSRRLEKPAVVVAAAAAKEKPPKPSHQRKVEREKEEREELGFNNNNTNCCEVEASFADNCFDSDPLRDRSTRESTPCSLIRDSNAIGSPGSTTRKTCSTAANRRVQNDTHRSIPATNEMEEFFAFAERQQQRLFVEKYNFDVANDLPLPGRFEWVQVVP